MALHFIQICAGAVLINGPTPKMLIAFMSVVEDIHGACESEQLIVCAEVQSTTVNYLQASECLLVGFSSFLMKQDKGTLHSKNT